MGAGHTFFVIGKSADNMTLGDIHPTGYADGENSGVTCQFLDEFGFTVDHMTYYWFDVGTPGEGTEGEDWAYGWYDSSAQHPEYNKISLVPGDGIWIFSRDANVSIQGSGEVPSAPVSVALRSGGGAKLVINPMPVELKMQDMYITGCKDGENSGVTCQFLDEFGYTINHMTYYWFDVGTPGEGTEGEDWAYGWYDSSAQHPEYNKIPLPAGTGVWMFSRDTGCFANFKSPIQKEVE